MCIISYRSQKKIARKNFVTTFIFHLQNNQKNVASKITTDLSLSRHEIDSKITVEYTVLQKQ